MRERIIYECEHCNKKRLLNKIKMKQHENICWYNDKNKTCITCGYNLFDGENNCCALNQNKNKKPIINCSDWLDKEEYIYGD